MKTVSRTLFINTLKNKGDLLMQKLYYEYCKSYKLNEENSEGFFDTVSEIYFSNEVQGLKIYEQHLDIDRLQHITAVAFLTYKICKRLSLDYKAASRAAVMHDLFYYDWRDGETGKWHCLHGYKHPKYACLNARELYPDLSDKEEDIIKCHMWPLTLKPSKYKEGLVVTFCDKYCATRELMFSLNKKYKKRFLEDIKEI